MAFYKKFSPDKRGAQPGQRQGSGRPAKGRSEGPQRQRDEQPARAQDGRPSSSRPGAQGKGRFSSQDQGYEPKGKQGYQGRGDRPAFGRPSGNRPGFGKPASAPASAKRFGPGSLPRTATPPSRPIPRAQMVQPVQDDQLLPMTMGEGFTPAQPPENLLSGRNPIREALKSGRDIEKLLVASGELSGSAREIVAMAKNAGIIVQTVERSRLDQITRNHQGMVAYASAYSYATVEDILQVAKERGEAPFIIILDKITDPQNLGAIIRTAACVGAHGVIVQLHRAVGLTPSAVRASAGAVEHVKVARVINLNNTIKDLKRQGIWLYAADAGGIDYRKAKFEGACALVIGNEGEGVSALTLSLCDQSVAIPMSGAIDSLNASVAAGILMYAVYHGRSQ